MTDSDIYDTHRSVFHEAAERRQRPELSAYAALTAITQAGDVVYALRLDDGVIKIGHTKRLGMRRAQLQGKVLAFKFGTYDDEQDVHSALQAHTAHGREYYHPTPEVIEVVNEWRAELDLPLL